MPAEPSVKRTFAFFDGQNLFYAAKYAFGYSWPNYDPRLLAENICAAHGWRLQEIRFYTGIPSPQDDRFWNHFWTAKLAQMGREGICTYSRHLKYRNQSVSLPGGGSTTVLVGSEKGIDVRLALDVVAAAHNNTCDVALIFSQDQDPPKSPTKSGQLRNNKSVGSNWPADFRSAQRTTTPAASGRPIGFAWIELPMMRVSTRGTTGRKKGRSERCVCLSRQKTPVLPWYRRNASAIVLQRNGR